MDKYAIAQIMREIAIAIELTDPYPKKSIAYRRAAFIIENIEDFDNVVAEGALETFPGIGKVIANMITILSKRGSLNYHKNLMKETPTGLFELALVPGLGANKVRILYEKFQVKNINDLVQVLQSEEIRKEKGFGPAYTKTILKRLATISTEGHVLLFPSAFRLAKAFLDILKADVERIEISGEIRRRCEIVKEIELVAIAKGNAILKKFAEHALVKKILNFSENKATVILKPGIMARLNLVTKEEFPVVLFNTTGNSTHLENVKKEAEKKDIVIKRNTISPSIENENDIYKMIGCHFIPPEIREGYGEIEAAKKREFHLIESSDIRGAFHCHTVYSDGNNTIKEMADAALALGWEYIGITDHSKSSYQANGMSEEKLLEQIEEIRKLNKLYKPHFQIFSGIECDILKDGQLDFADEILKQLDFVIVSVHRYFNLDEESMTNRLIKAIENPYTTMVGHLTGRLLNSRDPYKVNVPKVLDACFANHKIVELNAYPNRLDMDWRHWISARERGLKCSINPDAHTLDELKNIQYGVYIARKGWLEKGDVINTKSLAEVKTFFHQ